MRGVARKAVSSGVAGLLAIGLVVVPGAPAWADEIRDQQWMIDALKLDEAHEIATGEGVTVGIVDTGVDATHPDLAGSVIAGKDSWSANKDGMTDSTGHGTAMASLIVGHGHGANGEDGVLGVAPKAKLISYGALPEGQDEYDDAELERGIRWVIDNGADIVLLAYGGGTGTEGEEDLIKEATERGIPVVTGIGNEPDDVGFPAAYQDVIAVSATDRDGNFSDVSLTGLEVQVSAPGEDVMAARPDNGYEPGTGTSDSAAVVAGVLALIKSRWLDMSVPDMILRLTETARDEGRSGPDNEHGFGAADPVAALTAEVEPYDPSQSPHEVGDPIYESDSISPAVDGSVLSADGAGASPIWPAVLAIMAVLCGLVVVAVLMARRRRVQG